MRKVLTTLFIFISILFLVSCNPAENVKHNMTKDADNFKTYRKVTVMNLIDSSVLMEIEGYFSMLSTSTTDGLAILIRVAPGKYQMHYVYQTSASIILVEQLDITNTDPYHWKITIYATWPEISTPED